VQIFAYTTPKSEQFPPVSAQNSELCKFLLAQRQKVSSFDG